MGALRLVFLFPHFNYSHQITDVSACLEAPNPSVSMNSKAALLAAETKITSAEFSPYT